MGSLKITGDITKEYLPVGSISGKMEVKKVSFEDNI